MVQAYWSIGKLLYETGGENERSAYGIELDALPYADTGRE